MYANIVHVFIFIFFGRLFVSSICYYCCELLLLFFFLLLVSIWNKFSWKIDCLAVIYKMFRRILWTLFHQFSKSFAIFLYIKLLNVKMIHFSTKWKFINFTWKQFSVLFFEKYFYTVIITVHILVFSYLNHWKFEWNSQLQGTKQMWWTPKYGENWESKIHDRRLMPINSTWTKSKLNIRNLLVHLKYA